MKTAKQIMDDAYEEAIKIKENDSPWFNVEKFVLFKLQAAYDFLLNEYDEKLKEIKELKHLI